MTLINREVVLVKVETTYNVDPTPVAGDAVLVQNISLSTGGLRQAERPSVQTSIHKEQTLYAGKLETISFDVEIKGSGSAYAASVLPEMDALFRCCAMGATLVVTGGAETVTYKPVSTSHESTTIYYYQDGKLKKLTGCLGTYSINLTNGDYGKISFTITGHDAGETDDAIVVQTVYSTIPPAVLNSAITINAYAGKFSSLNIDAGNNIVTPDEIGTTDGYGQIRIINRDVNGGFDLEDPLVATHNINTLLKNGTLMALTIPSIGSTQYNRYNLSLPKCYYRDIGQGDKDGIRTRDITFGATINSGDDDMSIVFD